MDDDLSGLTLYDVLARLEKGKIGHRAAMDWLNIDSLVELVDIMHANGRLMPGHQPHPVPRRTRELLARIWIKDPPADPPA